ncbi:hypothetical protein BGZ99_000278 [Dissophora globulifera]|uniref:Uncharacterized protein n=1 Tax=Dissophora globulifera TaxID=979702 RepID=A0A9P6RPQ4_9FUNG|nr:hypothetical protein BGZ99_000278 [Dissophora globulifera]
MSPKACVTKGRRECVRGFHRDLCTKCTQGSIACEFCPPGSTGCMFCVEGLKECSDCYGLGFVQRICQDCIKEHYRSQAPFNKVKGQIVDAQQQLSRSVVSLAAGVYNTTTATIREGSMSFITNSSETSIPTSGGEDSDDSDETKSSSSSTSSLSLRKTPLKLATTKLAKAITLGQQRSMSVIQHSGFAYPRKWSRSCFRNASVAPIAA